MKKLIPFLLALCLGTATGLAADPDTIGPLTVSDINLGGYTQAIDSVTNDYAVSGWLDAIFVNIVSTNWTGSPTVTVSVATCDGMGPPRTLLTATTTATNNVFRPRDVVVNTANTTISNEGVPIPLLANKIVAKAYSSNKTNCNAVFYILVGHNN